MKLLRQPTRETCGQTCVAMLLDISVAEACELVGTTGRTCVVQLQKALEKRGHTLHRVPAATDCGKGLERYLVRIGNGMSGADHRSHFMVVENGLVYEPSLGERFGWSEVEQVLGTRNRGWRVMSCWRVTKKLW